MLRHLYSVVGMPATFGDEQNQYQEPGKPESVYVPLVGASFRVILTGKALKKFLMPSLEA